MNQQTTHHSSLFDLLARSWQRPSAVANLCFSTDGSAVAFACVDGTVAIAALADQEPPETRMRTSGDLGQTTIRPRERPPVPLIATTALADGDAPLAAYLRSDFLLGTGSGSVVHLTSGGELAETPVKVDGAVVSIDHSGRTGITAVSNGEDVFLSQSLGDPAKLGHRKASRVEGLAFSPNGRNLAFASAEGLSAWKVDGAAVALREISFPARALSIRWSGDGTWLACALESGGFGLVSMVDGGSAIVGGFPAPVRTACWSAAANALVTSGAFRITAWSMSAPPLGGDNSGALETGRAGLFAVETVAAHPDKKLVAAGYADGQIAVAQIGGRDELVVRPSGGAVTALAWSGDGRHLAAGAADGSAAIVTFPPQMFK